MNRKLLKRVVMKRFVGVLLLLAASVNLNAQHVTGFIPAEARDMIQVCNSYTYLDLYGSDASIIPAGYQRVYTSQPMGMDNMFQVYIDVKQKKGILNFRGSTAKKSSWLENMYASMIPAEDEITRNGEKFNYKLAEDSKASVHAGYVLALSYLASEIKNQINKQNKNGIYTWFITGHSQGGALTQLVRAYLNYLPKKELSKKNEFKVYAFANPMVGNMAFAASYKKNFVDPGMSFLLHNPEDVVPKMPLNYNDTSFLKSNLQTLLFDRENFDVKESAMQGMLNMFGSNVNRFNNFFSNNVYGQLVKELGDFKMPTYRKESNYTHTSEPLSLPPTEYPLELKDSSILLNDSLMHVYKRDENGVFENKKLYKKQSALLQHKPYNYYTALLKVYYPNDYNLLEQKYFVLPDEK